MNSVVDTLGNQLNSYIYMIYIYIYRLSLTDCTDVENLMDGARTTLSGREFSVRFKAFHWHSQK